MRFPLKIHFPFSKISLSFGLLFVAAVYANAQVRLPFDATCPVIYDNDSQGDVYAEALIMAEASAGDIALKGMIVTSIIDSPNTPRSYENAITFYIQAIASAKSSGFANLPATATRGVKGRLTEPVDHKIDSTAPLGTDGARLIVSEARKCSRDKPLVVCVGGPASTVVDAYLLDKSIADKLVMVWINGAGTNHDRLGEDYNGWADTWALYIAAHRLRIVTTPLGGGEVPKARILGDLPDKPFRAFMHAQTFTTSNGKVYPAGWDGDGSIVDGLIDSGWMRASKRVSFRDTDAKIWGRQVVRTVDDPLGNILVITSFDRTAQTAAWWRSMADPRAWSAASGR
jgi:hypothetical protein